MAESANPASVSSGGACSPQQEIGGSFEAERALIRKSEAVLGRRTRPAGERAEVRCGMGRAGPIVFFADRLPPLVGGVEIHAGAFVAHFTRHERFPPAVPTKHCILNPALVPTRPTGLGRGTDWCNPRPWRIAL